MIVVQQTPQISYSSEDFNTYIQVSNLSVSVCDILFVEAEPWGRSTRVSQGSQPGATANKTLASEPAIKDNDIIIINLFNR